MPNGSNQQQLLLTALPPSQRQKRAALGIIVILLIAFSVTAPFANAPMRRIDAFIPIFETAVLMTNLITSALLLSQFLIARRSSFLVLASGVLFTALIVIPHALTFPGLFAPTGVLNARLQSTAWLYIFWHAGSPLGVIAYVLTKDADSNTPPRSPPAAVGLGVGAIISIVCGLTWLATAGDRVLPRVFLDSVQMNQSSALIFSGVVTTLDAVALALLWFGRRSLLDLWLMVMCCAWLIEVTMVGTLSQARFSLGWYAGRIYEFVATFLILLVLLSETMALHANLARSVIRQRGARETRLIAMDAIAASIVYEINQPLAAMVTSANAGLRWLTRATPDLNEARSSFENIVNNGHRASEIINGVRSMFKKGAHGRRLLGVNDLVREVLKMVDLELRNQRVSVASDLRNGLPQLFANRGQLQQVFLNLILNAIEAMSSVTDRARVLRVSSDITQKSSSVVINIEDSGTGIKDSDKVHIFEPFFTTKSAGTGIGLAICRSIIESHGGSVRAFPNEPHGTILQVILPTATHEKSTLQKERVESDVETTAGAAPTLAPVISCRLVHFCAFDVRCDLPDLELSESLMGRDQNCLIIRSSVLNL
jgi:signal transduction histidine kinase